MLLNSFYSDHSHASNVWQEFVSYQKDEILKPIYRDTGQKPDRMRRQIFHSSFNNTYYIHQRDNRLDEKYDHTFSQAQKEYYCYLHAATLGLNLPEAAAITKVRPRFMVTATGFCESASTVMMCSVAVSAGGGGVVWPSQNRSGCAGCHGARLLAGSPAAYHT